MHWRPALRAFLLVSSVIAGSLAQTQEPAPAAQQPPPAPEGAAAAPAGDEEATAEPAAPPPEPAPEAAPEPPPAPPPKPAAPAAEDYEEPELPMTPPAQDSLGGHFVVTAGAAYVKPFGRLGSHMKTTRELYGGWGVAGEIGFGVSRQVVLGAWGQYAHFTDGSTCSACDGNTLAIGPFVTFHLVQGLRFDPWVSFGVSYRALKLEQDQVESSFVGMDWARLVVGGDWYPVRTVGLGPFLELVSGGFFDRPEAAGALRGYWQFAAGARLVLDLPGRLK